jgi:EmrB/QacA subfamily drug resistance transporter
MKKYAILCAVCLGSFLSAYTTSCINIALPNIMAALNFNMDSIVWVSLGYMLPYGSIMPMTGKLGDQFGAKTMYILGLMLFSAASLLCGLATSSTAMVIFRIAQGIGAGFILPNAMAVVAQTFPAHERGQAMGIWGAMAAVGMAMGPTLGGYLIEHFDWRTIFFSVGPVAMLSIVFAFAVIPPSRRNPAVTVDYAGAALLVISISSLLVALNQGQKHGWDSLYIVSLFYAAFAAMALFLAVELRVRQPMIDIRLFRNLNFTTANTVAFLAFFAFMATNFLLPFFLKSILDYSSITTGIMLLPMTVGIVTFSPVGGRLADRFGSKLPTFFGTIIIAYALYALNTIDTEYSNQHFFIRLSLLGMGTGLIMSPLINCVVSSLPQDKVGVGSGVYNLCQVIGGSVGVVFAQVLLNRREVYHTVVLKEYLNPATHSSQEIFRLLQLLWGDQGMDNSMLTVAARGWLTGQGLIPQQYVTFKALLSSMITRQASILSFQDVFFALALICFAAGLLALFIRRKTVNLDQA